jgi:5-methylcytosine-specific restriction endonuclease McrA
MNKQTKSRQNKLIWQKIANDLKAVRPACEICGGKNHLQVHHIVSKFYYKSLLRFEPANLVVVCPTHHFVFHKNPVSTMDWYMVNRRADWEKVRNLLGNIK